MVKIKIEKNEDVVDQVITESIELKFDVSENTTKDMEEVKLEKNDYKDESNGGNNEYFEENYIKIEIKCEEDFHTLNTNIDMFRQMEKASKEKSIAEFTQKGNIIDNILYQGTEEAAPELQPQEERQFQQKLSLRKPELKLTKSDWDMDGEYKRDEEDGHLVQVAGGGSLGLLGELLAKLPKNEGSRVLGPGFGSRAALLNHARRWTGVQDTSLEWFGDTALIAAARQGEAGKVKALLLAGADPTLEACPHEYVYEDALKAAMKGFRRAKAAVREVEEGKVTSAQLFLGAEETTMRLLERRARAASTLALVQLANSHWTRASYASQLYSESRKNGFITKPNSPRDPDKLHEELRVFDIEVKVVNKKKAEKEHLSACFEEALQKERIDKSADMKKLPAGLFQFQGAAGQAGQEGQGGPDGQAGQGASKRPRLQTGQNISQCQGCNKKPAAGSCTQHSCAKCCRGPCARHVKPIRFRKKESLENSADIKKLEFASSQKQSLSLPAGVFHFKGAAGQAGQAGQEGQACQGASKRPRLQTGHTIWSH